MKYLVMSAVLLAISCVDNQQEINTLSYVRDRRTGFCFATYRLTSASAAIINVPCTPEVERLIKEDVQ